VNSLADMQKLKNEPLLGIISDHIPQLREIFGI
jgi:hypothetical protein